MNDLLVATIMANNPELSLDQATRAADRNTAFLAALIKTIDQNATNTTEEQRDAS